MRKAIAIVMLLVGAVWAGSATQPDSTPPTDDDKPQATVDRVYDIRDYLVDVHDHPLNPTPEPPTTRPTPLVVEGAGNGPGPIDTVYDAENPQPKEDKIEGLIKLIVMSVEPDSWRVAGGAWGSIVEFQGKLYVTQTPDAQAEVQKIITEVTAEAKRTVRVNAIWLLLTRDELEALRDPASRAGHSPLIQLDEQMLRKAKPCAQAELLCMSGQTVHLIAGAQLPRAASATTQPSPAPDPASRRVILQINPHLNSDQNHVLVDVLNILTGPGAPAPATASVDQRFQTTANIPLGVDVVLGATSLDTADPPRELYLVIRIDAGK